MSPNFLSGVRHVVEEPSLFTDDVEARLEALRPQAGSGIGRAVLENVSLLSAEEANCFTVVQEALKAALVDRANRGARQVKEHYLRAASAPRANDVRRRLDEGIGCSFRLPLTRERDAGATDTTGPRGRSLGV